MSASKDEFPHTTISLAPKGRAEEMEATLRKRKTAGLSYNEQRERMEAEWFAAREAAASSSAAKTTASVRPFADRLTATGWVALSGLVVLLSVFLFPPWLGVEQLPREQDTTRSIGRHNVFSEPSPQVVRAQLATGEEIPQNLLGRFYFAKIDYARWWTEMFVCLAAAGAAMVAVRSIRQRS